MRRSSSIRCLSEVIGETSSDDKIRNRARKEGPRARRTGASQLPRSGLVQRHISEAHSADKPARQSFRFSIPCQSPLTGGVRFRNRGRAHGCRTRYRAIGGAISWFRIILYRTTLGSTTEAGFDTIVDSALTEGNAILHVSV